MWEKPVRMKRPVITLLTDFGTADHYAGAMKGVMLGIAPDAHLVDISHDISAYGIAEAAYTLAQVWKCFPEGTVHLVVIDPGVGSARRPIAAEFGGHYFVAPDNGVLTMAIGDAARVFEITAARLFRQPVSQTFHGRDLFSPVAAHLAMGVELADVGPEVGAWVRLDAGTGQGRVLKIDRFGNLITSFETEKWLPRLAAGFEMKVGNAIVSRVASSYADAGEGLFVIAGSAGFLEISARLASAAEITQVETSTALVLTERTHTGTS